LLTTVFFVFLKLIIRTVLFCFFEKYSQLLRTVVFVFLKLTIIKDSFFEFLF